MVELARFAAQSWWNLLVVVTLISAIGIFPVLVAVQVVRMCAINALKGAITEEAKQKDGYQPLTKEVREML